MYFLVLISFYFLKRIRQHQLRVSWRKKTSCCDVLLFLHEEEEQQEYKMVKERLMIFISTLSDQTNSQHSDKTWMLSPTVLDTSLAQKITQDSDLPFVLGLETFRLERHPKKKGTQRNLLLLINTSIRLSRRNDGFFDTEKILSF